MPAFVIQLNQICISYTYDGLTVYQTAKPIEKEQLKKSVISQSDAFFFERLIDRSDADHDFYHLDGLNRDIPHAHIKFKQMPTREQLSAMLQEFVRHKLITEVEKNQFFEALAQRYLGARSALDMKLDQSTAENEEMIINYLEQCEDNDVLADLHSYLGGKKFDHLRVHDGDLLKWVGTNANGSVISTSQAWARIEKCISLKMAMNYCEQTKFNADIGKRAASQFADTHSFFAIKRKAGRGQKQNNVVTDLATGNRDSLVNRYQKNFC